MKKVVSLISAIAMFAAVSGAAIAEGNNPEVYVNNAKIYFADQKAVIVDDRTLVPARGVFEAMGAEVNWNGDDRSVIIETGDHKTQVTLVIDDNNMKVYDVMSLFASAFTSDASPETVVELDVAPQIINDRTMIPLRAISEAVGADVQWDADKYEVDITTKDAPAEDQNDTLPAYFLTVSSDNVAEGETVDVFVNLKNIPADTYVSAVTASINYNPDNFEYVSTSLMNGENEIDAAVAAANPEFAEGCLKVLYATIDESAAATTDGKVLKITFKAKNNNKGSFSLSNGYHTELTYNTALTLFNTATSIDVEYSGNNFIIDTTPVVVNGETVEATTEPEATEAPEASAEPEATAVPETSAEPEATVAPEASTEPEASAEPEATEAPEATAEPAK